MDIKYIFLSNSLPFEESGYSPQMSRKLVKLLPLGLVHSTKGDFLVDHESFRSIRNRFMERQLQIPIDYEHQTLQDVQAPAAGWIKNIVLRNDGIYGDVDWTDRAADYLKIVSTDICHPLFRFREIRDGRLSSTLRPSPTPPPLMPCRPLPVLISLTKARAAQNRRT